MAGDPTSLPRAVASPHRIGPAIWRVVVLVAIVAAFCGAPALATGLACGSIVWRVRRARARRIVAASRMHKRGTGACWCASNAEVSR